MISAFVGTIGALGILASIAIKFSTAANPPRQKKRKAPKAQAALPLHQRRRH